MSPTLEREHLHKSPSLLVGDDGLDDDWDEWVKPRHRSSSVEVALNLCFTSLTSGARSIAKQLYICKDAHSTVEGPTLQATTRSLARASSLPATNWSRESNLNLFGGEQDKQRSLSLTEAPSGKASRLRSWTKGLRS